MPNEDKQIGIFIPFETEECAEYGIDTIKKHTGLNGYIANGKEVLKNGI